MFGDREVMNSFDSLFDLDRDGSLDVMESTLQLEFLSESERSSHSYNEDDEDDEDENDYFDDNEDYEDDEDDIDDEFGDDNYDSDFD